MIEVNLLELLTGINISKNEDQYNLEGIKSGQ